MSLTVSASTTANEFATRALSDGRVDDDERFLIWLLATAQCDREDALSEEILERHLSSYLKVEGARPDQPAAPAPLAIHAEEFSRRGCGAAFAQKLDHAGEAVKNPRVSTLLIVVLFVSILCALITAFGVTSAKRLATASIRRKVLLGVENTVTSLDSTAETFLQEQIHDMDYFTGRAVTEFSHSSHMELVAQVSGIMTAGILDGQVSIRQQLLACAELSASSVSAYSSCVAGVTDELSSALPPLFARLAQMDRTHLPESWPTTHGEPVPPEDLFHPVVVDPIESMPFVPSDASSAATTSEGDGGGHRRRVAELSAVPILWPRISTSTPTSTPVREEPHLTDRVLSAPVYVESFTLPPSLDASSNLHTTVRGVLLPVQLPQHTSPITVGSLMSEFFIVSDVVCRAAELLLHYQTISVVIITPPPHLTGNVPYHDIAVWHDDVHEAVPVIIQNASIPFRVGFCGHAVGVHPWQDSEWDSLRSLFNLTTLHDMEGWHIAALQNHTDELHVEHLLVDFVNLMNIHTDGDAGESASEQWLGKHDPSSPSGVQLLSEPRFADECPKNASGLPECVFDADTMDLLVRALAGESEGELIESIDYRTTVTVLAEVGTMSNLPLGVVFLESYDAAHAEVDVIVRDLTILATVIVVVGLGFLFSVTRSLLDRLAATWDSKRAAVEQQRVQVESLLQNMVPTSVSSRLLSGEVTVSDQSNTLAFSFADICGFTPRTKHLSSSSLVQFLSFTFGVFDVVAHVYDIYKVKTIGDAYFAVAGLIVPEGGEPSTKQSCYNLAVFASTVLHLFSPRYDRSGAYKKWEKRLPRLKEALSQAGAPTKGAFDFPDYDHHDDVPKLATPSASIDVAGGQSFGGKAADHHSLADLSFRLSHERRTSSVGDAGDVDDVQTLTGVSVRVGLTAGPAILGVIGTKTPAFDVWGPSVNLASRLEHIAPPNGILTCSNVRAALPSPKFEFAESHVIPIKGIGKQTVCRLASVQLDVPDFVLWLLGLARVEPRFSLAKRAGRASEVATSKGAQSRVDGSLSDVSSVPESEDLIPAAVGSAFAFAGGVSPASTSVTVAGGGVTAQSPASAAPLVQHTPPTPSASSAPPPSGARGAVGMMTLLPPR